MFRKSENLLDNYQRFYSLGEEIKNQGESLQDCVYQNSIKTMNTFIGQMSRNQNIGIQCYACQAPFAEDQPYTTCAYCPSVVCEQCQEFNHCPSCKIVVCKNCILEVVFMSQYSKFCEMCTQSLN